MADPEIWPETFDLSLGMVEIPAGSFPMGIDNMEPAEGPEHEVDLDDYWMDRYMVTNYQFAQFLSDGNSQYYSNMPQQRIQNMGGGQFRALPGFEHFPVVMVLWSEAVAYADWAGKRLPTEAEWEKAARGTDARVFPWGNTDPMPDQANYLFSGDPWEQILVPPLSPCGYYNGRNYDGFQTTDSPGPYGNYDMAGDVWEWVADWFDPEYYASSPYENPQGPETGTVKVIRGGDCFCVTYFLRSHIRYTPWGMQYRNANVGFRCVSSHP
jgi:formylglycine-generating enzyme required for sulfatase activity